MHPSYHPKAMAASGADHQGVGPATPPYQAATQTPPPPAPAPPGAPVKVSGPAETRLHHAPQATAAQTPTTRHENDPNYKTDPGGGSPPEAGQGTGHSMWTQG